MTAQDYGSQDSPRASRVRDTSMSGVNHRGHPDNAWVDDEVDCSVSSMSTPLRLRVRRTRAGPTASRPGPTRKRHQQPPRSPRRRYYVEYSESGSEVDEAVPLSPPPPPPVEQTTQPAATKQQPTQRATQPPTEPTIREKLVELARVRVITIFEFVIQVVADAFQLCRRFFSRVLAFFILWLLFWVIIAQFAFFARPICSLPIVSTMISSCRRGIPEGHAAHGNQGPQVRRVDHPKLVDIQTRTFDQLLSEGVANVGLSSEVRKAEMATNDLITLVKASELRSRDEIAERLGRFVDDARSTGRSLTSLGAKVLGAIDSITASNNHVLQTIEASTKVHPSLLARLLQFTSLSTSPTKKAVLGTFLISMENTAREMARLRSEADLSMRNLERLREHLKVLHEMSHSDNADLTAEREEILGELWAQLRQKNKRKLRGIDRNLDLLKNVDNYRKKASAHVLATIQTLDTLDADMENLRMRMAAPDVVGDDIPINVHIESIKAGVERMKERQLRARLNQDESIAKILEVDA